ncbi:MAG: fumarylacetoacetate hydrolase family protein [Chloroflexi bacterium]|nr:fumarylacetoacetate hydrolase family protein [Chloroflexota bacterium]
MRIVRYASPDAAGGRGAVARLGRVRGLDVEPLDPADGTPELMGLIDGAVLGRLAPVGPDPIAEPLAGVRLLAPLAAPGKVVAIGLNYVDHVAESKATIPAEPLVFAKFPSSIVGPGEAITWDPGLTDGVDFEAELGVVIGRPARRVPAERALEHVFAYTCLNDVSARDLQFRDGQWVRGKSLDSFCPIGPWLVTADEIPDPQALAITCEVSGERLQSASTADMIFGVAELIARLSHSFTLEAGDLIATGTPPGVGWFREPRRVLRDGDDVVVSIERVGRLSNPVRVP